MRALFPLKDDSPTGYRELRYALRSLALWLPDVTPLIVGPRVGWLKADHILLEDRGSTRTHAINRKVLRGLEAAGEDVLLCADDTYFLRSWDGSLHTSGTIGAMVEALRESRSEGNAYRRSAEATMALVGPQAPWCETHRPLHLPREAGLEVLRRSMASYAGLLVATTYASLYDVQVVPGEDTKVRHWAGRPMTRTFSSSPDLEQTPWFRAYLEGCFPVPSPYEVDA